MSRMQTLRQEIKRQIDLCLDGIERDAVGAAAYEVGVLADRKAALQKDVRSLEMRLKNLDAAVAVKLEWCAKNGILICE